VGGRGTVTFRTVGLPFALLAEVAASLCMAGQQPDFPTMARSTTDRPNKRCTITGSDVGCAVEMPENGFSVADFSTD
jgi:hypothetical protein